MKKVCRALWLSITLALFSCGWTTQRSDIGDNSQATVNQQADKAEGAKVQADNVKEIVTNNTDGIPVHWLLVGGLILGIVIPQPKWMKWLW